MFALVVGARIAAELKIEPDRLDTIWTNTARGTIQQWREEIDERLVVQARFTLNGREIVTQTYLTDMQQTMMSRLERRDHLQKVLVSQIVGELLIEREMRR